MAKKKQHFVPRVYLKAWETRVETRKEPQKQFDGVYYFEKADTVGEGATRETILWKPHLYTIGFDKLYLAKNCPKVRSFFVDEIFKIMNENEPKPVYGKYGHSIIKTKKSVYKHLYDISSWDYYYYDGKTARKNALLNRFYDIRCYLLEDSFSNIFEDNWENVLETFIVEVKNASPTRELNGDRRISEKVAKDMMEFFFMMLCRSPQFDAMGSYIWIKNILQQVFPGVEQTKETMDAVWFAELYRMFYKKNGGFYHTALAKVVENCQFMLFETYPNEGSFITSDNPAFLHILHVERDNMNGYYFPISPNHMLLIAKGNAPVNVVCYRMADSELIKRFNRIISLHSDNIIVSIEKERGKLI